MFDKESRTKDLEVAYEEIGVSHFDGNPKVEHHEYVNDLRAAGRQGTLSVVREILRERMEIEGRGRECLATSSLQKKKR